jgi:hypothetical protein
MSAFDGCAVLTEDHRVPDVSRLAAYLMPWPVRSFPLAERDDAVACLADLPGAAIRPRLVEPGVSVVESTEPLRAEDLVALGHLDGLLADHPTLLGLVMHARCITGLGIDRQPPAARRLRTRAPPPDRAAGAGQRRPCRRAAAEDRT